MQPKVDKQCYFENWVFCNTKFQIYAFLSFLYIQGVPQTWPKTDLKTGHVCGVHLILATFVAFSQKTKIFKNLATFVAFGLFL